MKEVFDTRKQERMEKLEELKNKNANLPRSSSAYVFKDRFHKMKQLQKHSIFNVQKLFKKVPKKKNQVKKRMTRNQYFKLMTYIKAKKEQNLHDGVKNRYDTDERPEFNYFKKRENRDAWEDYSYNPKTTLMLTRRIKTSMKAQTMRDMVEEERLRVIGDRLKNNLIFS